MKLLALILMLSFNTSFASTPSKPECYAGLTDTEKTIYNSMVETQSSPPGADQYPALQECINRTIASLETDQNGNPSNLGNNDSYPTLEDCNDMKENPNSQEGEMLRAVTSGETNFDINGDDVVANCLRQFGYSDSSGNITSDQDKPGGDDPSDSSVCNLADIAASSEDSCNLARTFYNNHSDICSEAGLTKVGTKGLGNKDVKASWRALTGLEKDPFYASREQLANMKISGHGLKEVSPAALVAHLSLSGAELGDCKAHYALAKIRGDADFDNSSQNQSMDGMFRCRNEGPMGVDYISCKKFLNFYQISLASQNVMEMGQKTYSTVQQGKIQEGLMEKSTSGDFHGAAIDGIKKNAEMKKNQEIARAGFFGTKAAFIGKHLGQWISHKNIDKYCEDSVGAKLGSDYCADLPEYISQNEGLIDIAYANGGVKGLLVAQLTEATGRAAVSGYLASEYNNQADIADEYTKKLEAMKGEDDPVYEVSKCDFNPQAEGCDGFDGTRRSGNNIEFGNVSVNNNTGTDEVGFTQPEAIGEFGAPTAENQQEIEEISGMFKKGSNGSTDNSFNAPSAGRLAAGGGGGAAGGGGGGGGGSAGAGGGGGGGALAANGGGGGRRAFRGKSAGYAAAKGGVGYSKGKGKGSKKGGKSDLSAMFGRKAKGRSVANQVEKGKILPKASRLFDKISERYKWARKNERISGLHK
jgi:hypothetical protein